MRGITVWDNVVHWHRLAARRTVGARLPRSLVLGVGRVSAIAACAVDVFATVSVARAHARHRL